MVLYKSKKDVQGMNEQTYILKNKNDFNLTHIFECGQCFRWNQDDNGIYRGVVGNNVLSAQETADSIIFRGVVGAGFHARPDKWQERKPGQA